ncbi:MAG: response regulator [Patescibacteria group bacterium]
MTTILFAHADIPYADVFRRRMETAGHACIHAHDAASCLQRSLQCQPDLLVLSLSIAGKNGFTFYDEIGKMHPRLPRVIIADAVNADDIRACEDRGCSAFYIRRHFSLNRFILNIDRYISSRPTCPPSAMPAGDGRRATYDLRSTP